jgi:hypothetical protein
MAPRRLVVQGKPQGWRAIGPQFFPAGFAIEPSGGGLVD